MANVLVLGGGFAGVVAAESLAQRLGPGHRIKLVSRHREFTFFPPLVRLAFGRLKLDDVFFDLVHACDHWTMANCPAYGFALTLLPGRCSF